MTEIRRLTLRDASILIASLAVAFGLIRAAWTPDAEFGPARNMIVLRGLVGALTSLTLALIVLRLLPPRPRWRRLARQPGYVAGVSALFGVTTVGAAWYSVLLVKLAGGYRSDGLNEHLPYVIGLTASGFTVACSWLVLALIGCRAEASWVDRAGRVLGSIWILGNAWFWMRLGFFD